MNCYVKEILIFNEKGEKRSVPLEPGLNVITGESKTGKSALIEIVDYCLCSKSSTIPQGEILRFAHLFAVVLSFPHKYLVIGRKKFSAGGSHQMYLKVETGAMRIQDLQLSYFTNLEPTRIKNGVQTEIERHLGLSVVDMDDSFGAVNKKGKASLRNMTPYLFQHQNLIANKHALFYRFDDFNKRKSTIEEFPVFMGWTDDSYFSVLRQIEEKEKELRQKKLSQKKIQELQKEIENEVRGLFRNYYSIIGKALSDDLSFEELVAMKDNLPDYDNSSFVSQEIQNRYNSLLEDRNGTNSRFNSISRSIKELENSQKYADEYEVSLEGLNRKSRTVESGPDSFSCPTCGKDQQELNMELDQLISAQKSLANELEQVSSYSVSYVKEIEKLSAQRATIKRRIRALNSQIEEIENTRKEIARQKDLGKQAIYAKAKLDLKLKEILQNKSTVTDDELAAIESEVLSLKQKLTKFRLDRKFKRASIALNEKMNTICAQLDFEKELLPPDLDFDLTNFTLTHSTEDTGDITLGEMGSGANWLACHLSVFLGFLDILARGEKCVVPSFLFIDQPSQVYFPHVFDQGKDEDIKQVENIYVQILKSLEHTKEQAKFIPQVVVTDHADNLDLGEYDFESFVRKRWTKGHKLI
ncbi:DUF3732 domain-containing protein [Owenweeksia hongkongensis]|uniref:DUF3732 domain-containing protein n=1 Tax=Owenweeksia hongkongensis TaxID=253245 RepID=UPI003A946C27